MFLRLSFLKKVFLQVRADTDGTSKTRQQISCWPQRSRVFDTKRVFAQQQHGCIISISATLALPPGCKEAVSFKGMFNITVVSQESTTYQSNIHCRLEVSCAGRAMISERSTPLRTPVSTKSLSFFAPRVCSTEVKLLFINFDFRLTW